MNEWMNELLCVFGDCLAADARYVSIGDISLQLKKPLKPELVPIKYSKYMCLIVYELLAVCTAEPTLFSVYRVG